MDMFGTTATVIFYGLMASLVVVTGIVTWRLHESAKSWREISEICAEMSKKYEE